MTAAAEPVSDHPIDRLLVVLDVVQAHAPPDLARWFSLGIDAFMNGRGGLEDGLALTSAGNERRPLTDYRLRQRNRHLRAAWACCPGKSPWARSCELARRIRRFDNLEWPRLRRLEQPPENASELRRALFAAFKCAVLDATGQPVMPKTARSLSDIVK